MSRFLAIDFETGDYQPDSACSVGLVLVENGKIVQEVVRLIRPPRRHIVFTHIHGLSWSDVEAAPTFGEVWPEIRNLFEGIDFLAAHNARFDKGVLEACCAAHGIAAPELPYVCTVALARRAWKIHPTNLAAVSQKLGIELNHHEALSDAKACAQIVMQAHALEATRAATSFDS